MSIREDDIAIRLALGAQRSAILRWMVKHVLRLTAAGIALGSLGAAWASRSIANLLFDVAPSVPAAIITIAALTLLCLTAAIVPSWRATRIDVLQKLHRA